ncbi:MAG: signal peptidase I [Chthoniobacterales bacterium]|nr:signal peptidase I [Chthoniobacterales bacterium]
MFFFTPRYRKEAKFMLRAARKLLRYRRDILPQQQIIGLREGITRLEVAMRKRSREDIQNSTAKLHELFNQAAPPLPLAGLRENTEVILVALVVALGVRAYFLQPFKIPTGSMQPTLYGVTGTPTVDPPPSWPVRAAEFVLKGRTYIDVTAKEDDTVIGLREVTRLHFFTSTEIITRSRSYSVPAPADVVRRDFKIYPGRPVRAGQPLVRGHADSGDQLFVDKVTYNFIRPAAGDVFVFRTTGIRRIEATIAPGMGSQYYIKRLAGLAGQTLRIVPPDLYIDGKVPQLSVFRRVMSCENGYAGYSNTSAGGGAFPLLGSPAADYAVPRASYFALGDNSYNSSDSRFFGPVPEANVVGRGLVVYWPFVGRWGLIN